MRYFITSNTNLLNSNKVWKDNFLCKTTKLDDYNKIFISLNSKQILSKYAKIKTEPIIPIKTKIFFFYFIFT